MNTSQIKILTLIIFIFIPFCFFAQKSNPKNITSLEQNEIEYTFHNKDKKTELASKSHKEKTEKQELLKKDKKTIKEKIISQKKEGSKLSISKKLIKNRALKKQEKYLEIYLEIRE